MSDMHMQDVAPATLHYGIIITKSKQTRNNKTSTIKARKQGNYYSSLLADIPCPYWPTYWNMSQK